MPNKKTLAAVMAAAFMSLAAQFAHASPVTYGITVSGTWDCELFRPMGQACPTALTGSLTVDSSKATFAEQLVGFSLPMVDGLTYTQDDLRNISSDSFEFDGTGTLTGFRLVSIIQGAPGQFVFEHYAELYADADGNRYRFGNRADPRLLNDCRGCVTFAVPEPGSISLLALALLLLPLAVRQKRRH